MISVRSILFIVLLKLLPSVAMASDERFVSEDRVFYYSESLTQSTHKSLLKDIDTLVSRNDSDLKNIDWNRLRESVQSVRVLVVDGKPFVGSGYRDGAVNLAEDELVFYNYEKVKSFSKRQNFILKWHEALGAAGYDDENYVLSIGIHIKLSDSKSRFSPAMKTKFLEQFNQAPVKKNRTYIQIAGGVTGVGGGGDPITAEIKLALVMYVEKLAPSGALGDIARSDEIVALAIDTPIEPKEFINQYKGIFNYKRLSVGISLHTFLITVLISKDEWQSPGSDGIISPSSQELLNQIIDVLQGLTSKANR